MYYTYNRQHFHKDDEITIVPINDQIDIPLHNHDFHELVVVLAGHGYHITQEEQYEVNSGDVFIIPPNQLHRYSDTNNLKLVNVMFWSNRIPLPCADFSELSGFHALFSLEPKLRAKQGFEARLKLTTDQLQLIEGIINSMRGELKERKLGYRSKVMIYFLNLVCELSRFYSSIESKSTRSMMRISRLLSYLEANYQKKITMNDMTNLAKTSTSSLNRFFLDILGVSPGKHLLLLRLKKAKELILNSNHSITEVAFFTGFNDSNYFSRQFKKVYRMSPKDYRSKSF